MEKIFPRITPKFIGTLVLAIGPVFLFLCIPAQGMSDPIFAVSNTDFDKITGTWYEILNSNILDLNTLEKCAAIVDTSSCGCGISIKFADFHEKTKTYGVQNPAHYAKTEAGGYRMTNIAASRDSWMKQLGEDGEITQKEMDEINAVINSEMFFYSDHETYLIQMLRNGGKVAIYVYSKNPKPTAETIASITNEVQRHVCQKVPVHLADCTEMADLQDYTEE